MTSYATIGFIQVCWSDDVAGEQVFIGLTTSGLCAAGLVREGWFLAETKKGRRLVEWCGTRTAAWILRGLLAIGVLFGLALASGVVNPVRWSTMDGEPGRTEIAGHVPAWCNVGTC